uniref:Aspartic peptidase DDI1-type domain-containing protein n=1 Tax=Fagus sylvatica TaxID=28930 RepID=A0A2N9G5G7_FAGSY
MRCLHIQHKVPPKYKDPGCLTISCTIGDYNIERALLDLGASVNLLPFSVYLQLGLGELKPTSFTLQLADRSVRKPKGVVKDVLIKVENFYYPVDFIILDIEPTLHPSANIPIILGRPFLTIANTLINCRNERMKITFGSMTAEFNIFNVNSQQLVDEECEYMNFIAEAPQEEFDNHCYLDLFETLPVDSIVSNELKPAAKIFDSSSSLDSLQILEEEQVVVTKNPLRSKKKSLLAYSDVPKLRLKKTPKGLPLASIEPHATSAVEVPSKESVDQEVEKAGEKTKFFEWHKTKRKSLQDTRLSRTLLNSSKKVALHAARMKSARGSNYSFGGSCSKG